MRFHSTICISLKTNRTKGRNYSCCLVFPIPRKKTVLLKYKTEVLWFAIHIWMIPGACYGCHWRAGGRQLEILVKPNAKAQYEKKEERKTQTIYYIPFHSIQVGSDFRLVAWQHGLSCLNMDQKGRTDGRVGLVSLGIDGGDCKNGKHLLNTKKV